MGCEQFDLSQDGKRLAFVNDEEGVSVLHVMDTATEKEVPLPKLPVGVIGALRWHKNGRELGFSLNNARSPGDCYSLDVTTGKVERWTISETAVKTDTFPEAELVRWKSFDGKMISGFLYKPAAKFSGKRPVLVVIHGGPEGQSQPTFLGRANYYLNEMGIALIVPNVRGSTGYGKTFTLLDNGFKRDDTYKDIDALFDWIASRPDLDADRIAVTGGSYGGHMTLAVSTFYSDRIRCSVDIVGMSNLVTFLEHTEAYRRDLRRVEYGDERDPKMREYLEKIAPDEQHRKDQKAHVRDRRKERSTRACHRIAADRRRPEKARNPGLAIDRERRRPRLPQEVEPRLPVLRHGGIFASVLVAITKLAAESDLHLKLGRLGEPPRHNLHRAEPGNIQDNADDFIDRYPLHEVTDGKRVGNRVPLRDGGKWHDAVLVFKADSNSNQISKILSIDPAVFQSFQQMIIQRKFSSGRGHCGPLLRNRECTTAFGA